MRMARSLWLTLLLAAFLTGEGRCQSDEAPPPAAAAAAAAPAPIRVIAYTNRHSSVPGFVEFEDGDVLVLRTPAGEVQSFVKARLLRVVRLIDAGPEGRRAVAFLTDGSRREGIVVEDGFEELRMIVEEVAITIPRDDVADLQLVPSTREQYEQARARLEPGDAQGRFVLAQWLAEQKMFIEARTELKTLLQTHEIPLARRLLNLVEAQIALNERPGRPERAEDDERRAAPAPARRSPLTDDDVNLIRVYELDFRYPPRVQVDRDTITRLIAKYGESKLLPSQTVDRLRLYRADPIDLVRLMFEVRARDLYGEVRVLTEPRSLALFRSKVHDAWLIPNCATSQCHGGGAGGRFQLFKAGRRDASERYANFLILQRLDLSRPDASGNRMSENLLDVDNPRDSLLLHYALPRHLSPRPHPDVPDFEPVFPRVSDPRIGDFESFVRSLIKPRPAHPIELDPMSLVGTASAPTAETPEHR